MLEVALRNRIHSVMTEARGERWFEDQSCLLGNRQPEQLAKAIQDVTEDNKPPTPGRIVAALTFSFWTSMLGKECEALWRATLHKIAASPGKKRKDFSGPLTPIRILRNRIAHHEPIIMWNLPKHHDNILKLIESLSPTAAAWCREHDRFDEVYPATGIILADGLMIGGLSLST
jgi:hypothetical protein